MINIHDFGDWWWLIGLVFKRSDGDRGGGLLLLGGRSSRSLKKWFGEVGGIKKTSTMGFMLDNFSVDDLDV